MIEAIFQCDCRHPEQVQFLLPHEFCPLFQLRVKCISVSFSVPFYCCFEFQICIARTQYILLTLGVSDNLVMEGTLYCFIADNSSLLCNDMLQKVIVMVMLRLKWSMKLYYLVPTSMFEMVGLVFSFIQD